VLTLDDYPSLALYARVVDHRSFSAAAREAGIAKSAVSRRIAGLEEALGVRLLARTTRALTVTEEGMRVYEHAAALVAAFAAAEDAAGERGRVRGNLRVNAPVTFGQMHLVGAVAAFLDRYPETSVELGLDDRIVNVVEGGFEVVIRIGRLPDSGLIARKLLSDRLVICAAPAYLEERGVPATVADLTAHNCLHYALVTRALEWRFRKAGGEFSVPTRGNFAVSDGTALREAALAGVGLAVVPSFIVAQDVREGRLQLVLEGARRAGIGIFAVTPHRSRVPARAKAFTDFLARRLARADIALPP
jgi:DNA-binding transcriptional LysR family regulator